MNSFPTIIFLIILVINGIISTTPKTTTTVTTPKILVTNRTTTTTPKSTTTATPTKVIVTNGTTASTTKSTTTVTTPKILVTNGTTSTTPKILVTNRTTTTTPKSSTTATPTKVLVTNGTTASTPKSTTTLTTPKILVTNGTTSTTPKILVTNGTTKSTPKSTTTATTPKVLMTNRTTTTTKAPECVNGDIEGFEGYTVYMECINNRWIVQYCLDGSVLMPINGKLTCYGSTTTERTTTSKECVNGDVVATAGHSSFLVCINNRWTVHHCSDGSVLMSINGNHLCFSSTTTAMTTTTKEPECVNGDMEAFAGYTVYVKCIDNHWVGQTCPFGSILINDLKTGRLVCSETTTSTTTTETPDPFIPEKGICMDGTRMVNFNNKYQYFLCINAEWITMTCPNIVLDPNIGCETTTMSTTVSTTSLVCINGTKIANNDTSYFECINNQLVATSCPSGTFIMDETLACYIVSCVNGEREGASDKHFYFECVNYTWVTQKCPDNYEVVYEEGFRCSNEFTTTTTTAETFIVDYDYYSITPEISVQNSTPTLSSNSSSTKNKFGEVNTSHTPLNISNFDLTPNTTLSLNSTVTTQTTNTPLKSSFGTQTPSYLSTPSSRPGVRKCKPNGFKIANRFDKRKYYECVKHRYVEKICPQKKVFDKLTSKCVKNNKKKQ